MPDKELIQTVLESLGVTKDKREASARCLQPSECCCPEFVLYFIFTDCVTINNGACNDWNFCRTCAPD